MQVCAFVKHTSIHTNTPMRICAYMQLCIFTYAIVHRQYARMPFSLKQAYVNILAYLHTCICAYTHLRRCALRCMDAYSCMCICTYVHLQIYAYTYVQCRAYAQMHLCT